MPDELDDFRRAPSTEFSALVQEAAASLRDMPILSKAAEDEVAIVTSCVPGSDIKNAPNHLARAEHDLAAAKKQVQMTKKMVARAMAK